MKLQKKQINRVNFKKYTFISASIIFLFSIVYALWMIRPLPSLIVDGSGYCVVRGDVTMPAASDPNIGLRYTKMPKPGISTLEGLKTSCTREDFNRLVWNYCLRNLEPYHEQVVTYSSTGTVITGTCGAFGCTLKTCPNSPEPIKNKINETIHYTKLKLAGFDGSGACVVRDANTSGPDFLVMDVGNGYAREIQKGARTVDELRTQCTDVVYKRLMQEYCKTNSKPVTEGILAYGPDGRPYQTTCSNAGCDAIHKCPSDLKLDIES